MRPRVVFYSTANNCQDIIESVVDRQMSTQHRYSNTDRGKPKYSTKNPPQCNLATTNPIWTGLGSNPGLCSHNPATSCLTHGVANLYCYLTRCSLVLTPESLCTYQYLRTLCQHYDHRPYILHLFFKINMSVFNDRTDLHLLSACRNNQRQSERQTMV
jgi:hypothetical protein